MQRVSNFGRNIEFAPEFLYAPQSEDDVLAILRKHRGKKIRVAGRLHAWSPLVETDSVYIDMRHLNKVSLDADHQCATVGAGCQVKRIVSELKRTAKVTIPSIGLIDEQAIAGAISTGTHGSGRHSLSHYMHKIRLATYDAAGEVVVKEVDSEDELRAARCSLGAMGVILSVSFRCRAPYQVEEFLEIYDTLDEVLEMEEPHPLQQFYCIPWQWKFLGHHRRETSAKRSWHAWIYHQHWFWFTDVGLHLLICFLTRFLRIDSVTRFFYRQLISRSMVKRWKVVDDAETMLTMAHALFRHMEIEIFVTKRQLHDTLDFVRELLTHCAGLPSTTSTKATAPLESIGLLGEFEQLSGLYCHHYAICVRKILPDDTLISMAVGDEPQYSLSFISYQKPEDRDGFLKFASLLAKSTALLFEARPHWGKHCPLDGKMLRHLYPEFDRFRRICHAFDPLEVFRNRFLSNIFEE